MTSFLHQLTQGILATGKVANGYILQAVDDTQLSQAGLSFAMSLYQDQWVEDWTPQPDAVLTDFIELEYETSIKVDHIRALQDQIKYGPFQRKRFICFIPAAEKMSVGAANAFLKTLEEPPEGVSFVMTTTMIQQVLPTIQSRCQLLRLPGDTPNLDPELFEDLAFLETVPIIEAFQKVPAIVKDRPHYREQLMMWVMAYRDHEAVPSQATLDKMTGLMDAYRDTQWMINLKVQLESLLIQARLNG